MDFRRPFLTALFVLLFMVPGAEARDIYVRLAQGGTCSIASDSAMTLTDGKGRTQSLGKSASLVVKGGTVTVGKASFALPARIASSSLLRFNKRSYRGAFLITQRGGLLNVLDVEQYLCGVLPAEVGADWPAEALRAQAIISRTYALKQSLGRSSRGYDVVDTVADQVYRGAGIETAKTNQAVTSTAHKILAYGNELAFTPFHSDSGGHTANNAHVWGTEVPYLTGVAEPMSYTSPVSSWSAKISRTAVEQAVAKLTGSSIAPITEARVSEVDKGGRAVNLTFVGAKGTRTVKASQFRSAVGASLLKSTMLTPTASGTSSRASVSSVPAAPQSGGTASVTAAGGGSLTLAEARQLSRMTKEGVFSSLEIIDMLTHPEKKREYYNLGLKREGKAPSSTPAKTPTATLPRTPQTPAPSAAVSRGGFSIARAGNDFVFYGKGWGHGVGLSQWGALNLAKNGWTAERILTHYYPGTSVRSYQ